ncbi:MAG: hypothetical protein MUF78_07970 [Candidatus Edwardsbacteria bacterium]|nr:hypothetical protein [Candidatus Edwardsbacteria bacterium]
MNSFIQEHIDSFIKWDMLVYFSRQPDAVETIDGLSRLTGKGRTDIDTPLAELVASGVLHNERGVGESSRYSVAPGFRHRTILEKINAEMNDRGARLKLLTMTMESIKKQNGTGGMRP